MFNMYNSANEHSSWMCLGPQHSSVFRGSIKDFIEKANNNDIQGISKVVICGNKIVESPYASLYNNSVIPSIADMSDLMIQVNVSKIKRLSFAGCTLIPVHAAMIQSSIMCSEHLEKLVVNTNQLGENGIIKLLNGLQQNKSIKIFQANSRSGEQYNWSAEMIEALISVIKINKSLELINLPNNQIQFENRERDIALLSQPYKDILNKELPTIRIELNLSVLTFNKDNVLNNTLKKRESRNKL